MDIVRGYQELSTLVPAEGRGEVIVYRRGGSVTHTTWTGDRWAVALYHDGQHYRFTLTAQEMARYITQGWARG